MLTEKEAVRLVGQFSRTKNFPKDVAGLNQLAKDLIRAVSEIGVPGDAIVRRCASLSDWCPTLSDFMVAARGIRGYQAAAEADQQARVCKLEKCDGSGWLEICHLRTRKEFTSDWASEIISRETYDGIVKQLDWDKQQAYAGRYRCKCNPPREDRIATQGKYA